MDLLLLFEFLSFDSSFPSVTSTTTYFQRKREREREKEREAIVIRCDTLGMHRLGRQPILTTDNRGVFGN